MLLALLIISDYCLAAASAPLTVFKDYSPAGIIVMQVWLLLKLNTVENKVTAIKDIQVDVKGHERRLTLAEPKIKRAHERCDEHKEKFDNLEKRGFSS